MTLQLNHFAILGLHGKVDINIPIKDNRLVIIGVNGLGKTTVVNVLYYVLTEQWGRLLDYEFQTIELNLGSRLIAITKADVTAKAKFLERHQKFVSSFASRSHFPSRYVQSIIEHPSTRKVVELPHSPSRDRLVRQLARELEVPSSIVVRVLDDMTPSLQRTLFEPSGESDPQSIVELNAELKSTGSHQVLYLPTYRRIEQDLQAVFPTLDETELRRLTSAVESEVPTKAKGHVELIQFGMQDVATKIASELDAIQKRTRSQLSGLTASYLQDIIRNRADKIEPDLIRLMNDAVVESVLNRVEENTLSADDKREVRSAIRRLRGEGTQEPQTRDRYLTYFFSRLLEIWRDLYDSEKNIRELVETCNRYLERKQIVYNDADFTASIRETDGSPLSWKVLSSGEKQVVSLFTHLYLSQRERAKIVLIDEPELSLSVPWQKSILPDISKTDNCALLIAVTHSPFIYANELEGYAVDLSRLTTTASGNTSF